MSTDSSTTQATLATVEKLYDCGQRGDYPGFFALLSTDIVLHEPPYLPYGGVYIGHESVSQAFAAVTACLDLSRLKVEYKVAQGERVFAVVRIPSLEGGDVVLAEEWRVREGKVLEIRIYFHDTGPIALRNRADIGK